ncbi:DUF418 domain-containing protein [uncultured Caulobacter sp.]|uniref:DUF418 domain-containing protein n=1 Tax=uncultured Caulobacter sp. TaxID=158749 RepID=UPI00260D9C11|nr:DUF418 domain-containing protein [uncultured Caulobacter sp.]
MTNAMTAAPARNLLIDTLRAFALIGVYMVHMFEQYEIYWAAPQQNLTHVIFTTFFMGKAFSLLTLCFGLSFFLLMDKADRRGVDFSGRFAWRMAVLALIGLAHSLVYRGDILMVLAPLGLILVPYHRASNQMLLGVAAVLLLQPGLLFQLWGALGGEAWANQPPHHYADTGPAFYRTAPLDQMLLWNVGQGQTFKWWFFIETGRLFQILALFLVGLRLGRAGFFDDPNRFKAERRAALTALAAFAIACHLGAPALQALAPDATAAPMARKLIGTLLGGWFDVSLMGVYVLLIVEAYTGPFRKALDRLAPMGRMTLTFYVLQSLIWVPIFYGFGLGAWKWLPQATALWLGVGFLVVQGIVATLWFKRFYYGPLEWVWRAATYQTTKVPFLRKPAT